MTTSPFFTTVSPAEAGKRLDVFLARAHPAYSRSYFGRLIAEGGVLLNGKKTEKDVKLKNGDAIAVTLKDLERLNVEADSTVPFSVVFDGDEFAIIEKPAGVVTHPSDAYKKGTLVNGLLARWPEIHGVGEDVLRPGIVHRLDKETSGLMVIAKTQNMFLWLKKQFQEHAVEKHYTVLVFGNMKKDAWVVDAPIGRSGIKQTVIKGLSKGVLGNVRKSRNARTGFKKIASFKNASLLEALPETGRMHQIRVHCKHMGHPVVGDKVYASVRLLRSVPCPRQFLHASYLRFSLPNGVMQTFHAPLPEDLQRVLGGLEK